MGANAIGDAATAAIVVNYADRYRLARCLDTTSAAKAGVQIQIQSQH